MKASEPTALPVSNRLGEPARVLSEGVIHRFWGPNRTEQCLFFLPVKSGAGEITELFRNILAQRCDTAVEIVAVDSGSDDRTVQILRGSQARVTAVPPELFSYWHTRNVVASYARGDVFVFGTTVARSEHPNHYPSQPGGTR